MESSRTSLASRTHFEVLGLSLEVYKSSKMPCPRQRTALFLICQKWLKMTFFVFVWNFTKNLRFSARRSFFWRTPKIPQKICNFFQRRPFFFEEHLRIVSLVLGLGFDHSCPWPREGLSSESRSLASFFCVLGLGLERCFLDSISALRYSNKTLFFYSLRL